MNKYKFLKFVFLMLLVTMIGCGPSTEDFDCAKMNLERAISSSPSPSDDVIKILKMGVFAAEERDHDALKDSLEDARLELLMTLAKNDMDHISPKAALHVNEAMACIDYCPVTLENTGKCP